LGEDGLPIIMSNPGIVPDVAVIDIDHKFMPHETSADIRADFEAFVAHFCATDPWLREHPIEVKWDLYDLHFPPMNTSADHELVKIVTARRASLGRPTVLRGSIGVTDGAHYAVAGVQLRALRGQPACARRMGGCRLHQDDNKNIRSKHSRLVRRRLTGRKRS
jgi:acetylornithine deacetylase